MNAIIRASCIRVSWLSTALFAIGTAGLLAGNEIAEWVAIVVAIGGFTSGIAIWIVAFLFALKRSAAGEYIAVASLFFLTGSAPPRVRNHLMGSLGITVLTAALGASADPFGILAPIFPLALAGLWGARHGQFPPRSPLDTSLGHKNLPRSSS